MDDGTSLRSTYFVVAAIFILAPLAVLGFVALSNARSSSFVRAGIDARGVILAAEQTGMYVNEQPQIAFRIRVERGDRPPYEVEHRAVISLMSLAALQPGTVLDIKVSSRNPTRSGCPAPSCTARSPQPATMPRRSE
ncbi:hypothetical protein EG835_11005 [bacterium]|nr:hypothetical protein [bacterium]